MMDLKAFVTESLTQIAEGIPSHSDRDGRELAVSTLFVG